MSSGNGRKKCRKKAKHGKSCKIVERDGDVTLKEKNIPLCHDVISGKQSAEISPTVTKESVRTLQCKPVKSVKSVKSNQCKSVCSLEHGLTGNAVCAVIRRRTSLPAIHTVRTPPERTVLRGAGSAQPSAPDTYKKPAPLLTAIKPENERAEKQRFFQAKFLYNPLFIYRNPAEQMVLNRFGSPHDTFLQQAVLIMKKALLEHGGYDKLEESTGGKLLTRGEILTVIKRYMKEEGLEEEINLNLSEDLLSRASMTKGKGKATLNVRIVNLRQGWVEGLLRHELGTHYLRSCNNKNQVWFNWKKRRELGLKPFNPTEEGLASLHSVLLRDDPSLFRSALLYYTAYQAAYLPFKELFEDLGKFVRDPQVRWDYCMRAKRGQQDTAEKGGFCKDQVYLEGALQLLKHRNSIDFRLLVSLGKIAYQDVSRLEELADFSESRLPKFLKDYNYYMRCLDRVAEANGLTDDVLEAI